MALNGCGGSATTALPATTTTVAASLTLAKEACTSFDGFKESEASQDERKQRLSEAEKSAAKATQADPRWTELYEGLHDVVLSRTLMATQKEPIIGSSNDRMFSAGMSTVFQQCAIAQA
jgi:hypothetical protein